jgi:hypothetical protein
MHWSRTGLTLTLARLLDSRLPSTAHTLDAVLARLALRSATSQPCPTSFQHPPQCVLSFRGL